MIPALGNGSADLAITNEPSATAGIERGAAAHLVAEDELDPPSLRGDPAALQDATPTPLGRLRAQLHRPAGPTVGCRRVVVASPTVGLSATA
jgi:hypothetical protein